MDNHVFRVILAAFFLHMINSVFFLILNLYLSMEGFADHEIADVISYRFLAVMILAFPIGFYIRGKKLKPFFYFASIFVPLSSIGIILSVDSGALFLTYFFMILWGIAFTSMQITILPYILRNANPSTHTESISLNFSSWSISMLVTGLTISIFNNIDPGIFSERNLMLFFGLLGFLSIAILYSIRRPETVPESEFKPYQIRGYDWPIIIRAMIPTFIIAVGAGLTIPFINLFFFHVYGIGASSFALMGTITSLLVAMSAMSVPAIKRRFGYSKSITLSQSISVVALVILASTELFSQMQFAVYIAIGCYIIRQPLMSLAHPLTSEVTMYYVGRKNQEIISAMTSSIWSGSWFVSSQVFRFLRGLDLSYSTVFYITAALYAVGVAWYYYLVKDYQSRKKSGVID